MATVEQITAYIAKLKKTVIRLNAINKKLKAELTNTKEFSVDHAAEIESDLFEMEAKVERLSKRNAKMAKELKTLKLKAPAKNRVAVLHGNEWKVRARAVIESGQMAPEQWRCILEALLFEAQEGELDAFDELVEHGFNVLHTTADARTIEEGLA